MHIPTISTVSSTTVFTQHITDQMGAAAAAQSVLPLSNSSEIEQLSQLVSEACAEHGDHRGYVAM
jgi:hypothetical protein